MDYGLFDAMSAGFTEVVFVIRTEIENAVRSHVRDLLDDSMETAFVLQKLDGIPAGFDVPANRTKPWGTAQAVLAAKDHVTGPFAVCNADDFYGASCYRTAADYLGRTPPGRTASYALMGYRLDLTLSESGGVSRAVCKRDSDGFLSSIAEIKELERGENGIVGSAIDGETCTFKGDESVSMNFWGFTPDAFARLERLFARFLATVGDDPESEFLIPSAVSEMVADGITRIRVLEADTEWMGITFPDDQEHVAKGIRRLVDRGDYPADLAAWFKNR